MKIELESPFKEKWSKGYIVTNKENRRMVVLFNSHTNRTTISYARYLLGVREGRELSKNEQADHINGDKTNDSLDNLQILSPLENHHKTFKRGETMYDHVCPVCSKPFQLSARQNHKTNPTCSRKCGGIKSHWKISP